MRIKPIRRMVQLLFLPVAYAGFIVPATTHIIYPSIHCYACPLSVYICPIGIFQNFVKMPSFPFYLLGWVFIYGMAAGRAICGWLCPFGLFNDFLSPLNGIRHPNRILVKILIAIFIVALFFSSYLLNPRAAVGIVAITMLTLFILHDLHFVKYLLLSVTLVMALVFADTIFCKSCAVASIEASIPHLVLSLSGESEIRVRFVSLSFMVHILTLALAVGGVVIEKRFWCRYICPMGAVLALFNRVSLVTIRHDRGRCDSKEKRCSAECIKICPMGVTGIGKRRFIDSGDCIRCGACVDVCPNRELRLTVFRFGEQGL
ncbi:MAG: 4Fe-4S binding protein [Planctomycetota bacterium]|nr:4Fe-4S binding protein [Planctomycetota bacterium]